MRRRAVAALTLLVLVPAVAAVAAPAEPDVRPASPSAAGGPGGGAADGQGDLAQLLADREAPAGAGTWPLAPPVPVVRGFDPPSHRWLAGHRGVDLAGRVWQPVRAALGGVVRHAGPLAGRGVVVVDHGGTRTTYEPVTASVRVGQRVTAGSQIGNLQLAASHCLPAACLHWGWRRGETYLDPLRLVGDDRVRLKPVDAPAGRPSAAGRW